MLTRAALTNGCFFLAAPNYVYALQGGSGIYINICLKAAPKTKVEFVHVDASGRRTVLFSKKVPASGEVYGLSKVLPSWKKGDKVVVYVDEVEAGAFVYP